jgi:hypothetical protein
MGLAVTAAASAPSGGTTAEAFAHRVLAEASVPPGARLTTKDLSGSLGQPFETPGVLGVIDLHRLYLVNELPDTVESYVEGHLPEGGEVTETGSGWGPTGTTTGVEVSLPVSGPHEYLAKLVYEFALVGATNETEIRVDSQTVWEPNRSAAEQAPAGGIVEVTGFSQISDMDPSSGPVMVQVNRTQAKALRAALNALPLGPPAGCMEDSLLYRITFRRAAGSGVSFEADGWACIAAVVVTEHGREMSPLYDETCSLLRAVVAVLPTHQAEATRHSSAGCRT